MIFMQQALWSGRFAGKMDDSTLVFTSSLYVDSALAHYDVFGSWAHVKMLKACNIIPSADADAIINGLKTVLNELGDGSFPMNPELEDIHTNVEFRLTEIIGPTGGKLHTGRSRNDQVATDFRMYLRDAVLGTVDGINNLILELIHIAEANESTILPGFTHMQHAQPVTLAQHMLAHAFRLDRDADRFMDAFTRLDRCPLGAAALAGTTYPIDREMTAEALGFEHPTENSMDSVSDRDFVTEIAFCASLTSVHLSSLCEELIIWSSPEFSFIEMDDKYTTGSSIMPQKKNPDIAELVRGRTGSIVGSLMTMITMTKGLPLTYNRDLQEDKRPVMDALSSLITSVRIMADVISTTNYHKDRMLESAKKGFINATDLADYLVTKGVPFREAHGIVGAAVRYGIDNEKELDDMTLEELQKFSSSIEEDVFEVLPVEKCVERRKSYGGTSPLSTDVQIGTAMELMMVRSETVRQKKMLIEKCWEEFLG